MSYPNVFVRDGEVYMMPEMSAGHKLVLYKAVSFPEKWEQHQVVAENVMWVDTTFCNDNGIVYAITTDVSDEEHHIDYLLKFDNQFNISEKMQIHEKAAVQMLAIVYVYRKYSCDFLFSIFLFVASADYLSWMHNGIRQFIAVSIIFACLPLLEKKKMYE